MRLSLVGLPRKNGYNDATSLRRDMDYGDWKHLSEICEFCWMQALVYVYCMVLMGASDISFLCSENGGRAYV